MKIGDVVEKVGSGIVGVVIGAGVLAAAGFFAWVAYRLVFVSGPILGTLTVFGLFALGWIAGRDNDREQVAKRQRATEEEGRQRLAQLAAEERARAEKPPTF